MASNTFDINLVVLKIMTTKQWQLAIRPDHPRLPIKIKFSIVGGLRCVVIYFKYHPNRLRGYGAVGVENDPSPLLWPVA